MLLEFSVGNYLSFKAKTTLSLGATPIKEHVDTNIFSTVRYNLLKGAVIYGANASGKSNFIKAMSTMRRLVLQSFDQSSAKKLDIVPFLLNVETEIVPSFFEIIFLIDNVRYRYGFEVNNFSVHTEWLFEAQKQSEKPLFIREQSGIEVMTKNFPEGKDLEERTRDNTLFLAVVDKFNGKIAKKIMKWFSNFITISGLIHENYKDVTFNMLENRDTRNSLLDFYKKLDFGFEDVTISRTIEPNITSIKLTNEMFPKWLTDSNEGFEITINTVHKKYDKIDREVGKVEFDMRSQESSGTNKLFNISGSVFDVLKNGGTLVADELDSSLHPLLTLAITKLFNSKEFNPNNAQLIFATQDTNLLNYGKYRRDQIYFIEKNKFGASEMYSLVEYKEEGKTIRKDRSYEKDYIEGRYGAIPFIGNLSNVISGWQER